MNKYNWDGIHVQSGKDDWKNFEKIMQLLFLIFCMLRKKKYILLIFQNIT